MSPVIGPFTSTVEQYHGEPTILVFYDQEFKIANNVGGIALLEFAASAQSGLDSSEMAGLSAIHDMIQDTLDPEEWERFKLVAKKNKAPISQLMEVCTSIYAVLSNRPTQTASDSQSGLSQTSTGPTSNSDAIVSSEITTELQSKRPANKRANPKVSG